MGALKHPEGMPAQKRRSDRIFIGISLSISGTDQKGRDFTEHASTETVSRFGASIITKLSLFPEQELTLKPVGRKKIRARVIGQTGISAEGHVYGIVFLNGTVDLWGIHFPPFSEAESASTALECCRCHSGEGVRLNELELDVFRANDRLTRFCLLCGDLTTWRLAEPTAARKPPRPSREPRPERPEELPELVLPPEAALAGDAASPNGAQLQRRLHTRVRMAMKACIAQPGSEDDIVTTINMSRGGILVRSERMYLPESWIQLAVPYIPAAANIFVPARIIWRADVQGVYQYGIKYVKS